MNSFIIYFLFLLQIKKLKGRSDEFNECISLTKTITNPLNCLDIKIPDYDGYKCCSMKITYNNNSSYSCFALESKYTTNQTVLNEYISEINISSLFNSYGGEMEINCGDNLKIEENYKKLSDEYLNCYNNHIKGIENENDCISNEIPEGSKCCFVETTQNKIGNIINDKRCYVIQEKYFTDKENLSNYLLDESKSKDLNEINDININIICKNQKYNLSRLNLTNEINDFDENNENNENNENYENNEKNEDNESKKKSKLKTWVIILIVILIILLIGIIIIFIIYKMKHKKENGGIKKVEPIESFKSGDIF